MANLSIPQINMSDGAVREIQFPQIGAVRVVVSFCHKIHRQSTAESVFGSPAFRRLNRDAVQRFDVLEKRFQ